MRPAFSIEATDERRLTTSSLLLVFFIWFALQLTNAFSNLRNLELDHLGRYTFLNAVVITAGAALALLWRKRAHTFLLNISYLLFSFQLLTAALMLEVKNAAGLWNIALYLVFLLAVPALFRIWPFKAELIGAALCFACAVILALSSDPEAAINSLIVTGIGCTAVLAVSFRSAALGEDRLTILEQQGYRQLEKGEPLALAERAWSVALLQASMVSVLIFLDFAFSTPQSSPPYAFKISALLLIVTASCLYTIIKRTQLAPAIVLHTVLVGVVLSLGGTTTTQAALIHGVIPLIYLSLTTAGLPWALERQIMVAWALFWVNLSVETFSGLAHGDPLSFNKVADSFSAAIAADPSSRALLALGLVFSVLLGRFLRQQRLRTFTLQIDRRHGKEASRTADGQAPEERLLRQSASAVIKARTERLIRGVFVLGTFSCLISSALLLREDPLRWLPAGLVWLLFLFVWSMLVFAHRRESAHRPMWAFAAFVAVVLLCWPSILLVRLNPPELLWLCWPLSLLIGIGLVPWGLRELTPLLAVSLITGVEIAYELSLPLWGLLLFVVIAILSVLSSFRQSRRLKEVTLARHFEQLMGSCREERDVLRHLADHLSNMCDGFSAVVGCASSVELIRNGRVFGLGKEQWDFSKLETEEHLHEHSSGISCGYLNWIPPEMGILDERFGVFSPQHGLLIKFGVVLADDSKPAHGNVCVFLAFEVPSIQLVKAGELQLVRSLVSVSRLRLEAVAERRAHLFAEESREAASAERELELGSLVHDINNTVQDLTVLCENILEDPALVSSPLDHSLVSQIQRVTAVARSMAMSVSDAKRRRELEKQPELHAREVVDLAEVVDEITAFSSVRAERKRISIILEKTLPEESVWVKVSAKEHLETILRNLLNNAILYSAPGGLIRIDVSLGADAVRTKVSDNGPGLEAEEIERIFQPGYRGKAGVNIPGGLGIGLYQSRRVAEAAGGMLDASSEGKGKGAAFILSLPLQPPPAIPAVSGPWALMVDDQVALTDFYGKIAHALHLLPGIAASLEQAIGLCVERGKPAFVLTDVHLAAGNGLDLVRYIRTQFGASVPVLVVSGIDDQDIAQQTRSAGATDFVAKPIGRRALFARIQSLLVP